MEETDLCKETVYTDVGLCRLVLLNNRRVLVAPSGVPLVILILHFFLKNGTEFVKPLSSEEYQKLENQNAFLETDSITAEQREMFRQTYKSMAKEADLCCMWLFLCFVLSETMRFFNVSGLIAESLYFIGLVAGCVGIFRYLMKYPKSRLGKCIAVLYAVYTLLSAVILTTIVFSIMQIVK